MKNLICWSFFCFASNLLGQNLPFFLDCNEPPISTETCGTLNATVGLSGREIFCDGEEIVFRNLTPQAVDTSIFCWGDGSYDIVAGRDSFKKRYTFPRDTCLRANNGIIRRRMTLIVFKRCANGISISSQSKEVFIRVKPQLNLIVPRTACEQTNLEIQNLSCGNDIADSVSCQYRLSDGRIFNQCQSPLTIQFPTPGDYEVEFRISNRCGEQRRTYPITVVGLPTAVAAVVSGATLQRDTFEVCLNDSAVVQLTGVNSRNALSYKWTEFPILGWRWQWSSRHDMRDPSIVFTALGVYTITLTTDNSCRQPRTASLTFRVLGRLTLPQQRDTCFAFPYQLTGLTAGVTYEHYFNSVLDANFNPLIPFQANIGTHRMVARRGGSCPDTAEITFRVESSVPIHFITPTRDTTVCPNTGLIPIQVTGGTLSNNVFQQGNQSFFNTATATMGTNHLILSTGTCGAGDSIKMRVRDTIVSQLNSIVSRCQGFMYKPNPYISQGIYSLNGTVFRDSIQINATGDYEVMLVVPDSCGIDTLLQRFNISGLVSIQMQSRDTLICRQSNPITLRATTSGGNGLWAGNSVSGNQFNPLTAGVGRHHLTFSAGTGECANRQNLVITVGGLANVDAGRDTAICNTRAANPFQLPSGQPLGGIFRLNNPFTGTTITTINPATFPASSNVYYVITDSFCVSYDSLRVNINAISAASLNLPNAACVGLPIQLAANPPTAGLNFRVFINDTLRANALPYQPIFNSDGSKRIAIEVRNAANCADTLTRFVDVKRSPIPRLFATPNPSCHGQLLDNQNDTRWNDSTTTYQAFFRNQPINVGTRLNLSNLGCEDSTYALRLNATTGVCPTVSTELAILVHSKLIARAVVQGTDTSLCANTNVQITNTTCGTALRHQWMIENQSFTTQNPPLLRFDNNSDTIRLVTAQLIESDNCGNDTFRLQFRVYPLRVKARFSFTEKMGCQPFKVHFRSQSPLASSVLWLFCDGTTSNRLTVSKTFDSVGVHCIRLRVFHPCGGYEDITDSITVKAAPKTNGLTYFKPEICRENWIRIQPNITNGVLGRIWMDGQNFADSSHAPTFLFSTGGNYLIKYDATHSFTGCSVTDSGLVTVRPAFKLEPVVFSDSCGNGNGSVALLATGGAGNYRFAMNDTAKWQLNPQFTGLHYGNQYLFVAKDGLGCELTLNTQLTGRQPIHLNAGADTLIRLCDTFCRQISTDFKVSTVLWKIEFGAGMIGMPTQVKTSFFPTKSSEIYVLATDSLGCKAEGRFKIGVNDVFAYYVPNVFSPNGDGVNDEFRPYFPFNVLKIKAFSIYTRWGERVHSVQNVAANHETVSWNGFFNGKILDPAVYIWMLQMENCDGKISDMMSGDVMLVR
jgi:gliding motility-associated-like protein